MSVAPTNSNRVAMGMSDAGINQTTVVGSADSGTVWTVTRPLDNEFLERDLAQIRSRTGAERSSSVARKGASPVSRSAAPG